MQELLQNDTVFLILILLFPLRWESVRMSFSNRGGFIGMEQVFMKKRKQKKPMSATKKVAFSFMVVIFVGSILLSMPFANKINPQPYIDNLFVSTSAVCVTGLTPLVLIDQYNLFGQLVVMVLIQIGGLGFLTFLYLALFLARKKISLKNKMVFTEALNQDNLIELPRLLKTIFFYTLTIEIIGAILFSIVFVKDYGWVRGIYYGIWHSVSGFCNAGFDLVGSKSMIPYQTNPVINFVIPFLIIMGGIGFIVILDIHDKVKAELNRRARFSFRRLFKTFALHTKIVLIMTITLLLTGTALFMFFEYNNAGTIAHMTFGQKLAVSFFQSTTTRTAGFSSVDMYSLNRITKIIMCILMFIGGSPASTAGGIKTVTFALVLLMLRSVYRGKEETYVFNRRLKKRLMLRAFSIFAISLTICLAACMILTITEPKVDFLNIAMEVFSAFGTVGLSASVTPALSFAGKVVDILLMYTGRIGPVTMMILFTTRSQGEGGRELGYPDEDVLVG